MRTNSLMDWHKDLYRLWALGIGVVDICILKYIVSGVLMPMPGKQLYVRRAVIYF